MKDHESEEEEQKVSSKTSKAYEMVNITSEQIERILEDIYQDMDLSKDRKMVLFGLNEESVKVFDRAMRDEVKKLLNISKEDDIKPTITISKCKDE